MICKKCKGEGIIWTCPVECAERHFKTCLDCGGKELMVRASDVEKILFQVMKDMRIAGGYIQGGKVLDMLTKVIKDE